VAIPTTMQRRFRQLPDEAQDALAEAIVNHRQIVDEGARDGIRHLERSSSDATELLTTITSIADSITQVVAAADATREATESTRMAAGDLSTLSTEMTSMVSQFRLADAR
jgi:methyl-accepting chemotaxis protein